MTGTGLLLAYRLHGSQGLTIIGMGRHEWGNVHLWISYIAVVAVVAHLFMNWTWLKKIASSMKPLRLWVGLLAGILIIAVFALLPVSNHRLPENQGTGKNHQAQPE
jgi:hypothetical protein